MIVEFVGFPGSGKSTLAKEVGKSLKNDGLIISNKTYTLSHKKSIYQRQAIRTFKAFAMILHNPIQSIKNIKYMFDMNNGDTKKSAESAIYCLFINKIYHELKRKPGIHLVDQGIFQMVWTLYYRHKYVYTSKIDRWLTNGVNLPTSMTIVIIDVDNDIALERVAQRNSRYPDLDKFRSSTEYIERCESSLAQTSELLENVAENDPSNFTILRVDSTDKDPQEIANEISKFLKNQ